MPEGRQLTERAVGPAAPGRPPQKGVGRMTRTPRNPLEGRGFSGPGVEGETPRSKPPAPKRPDTTDQTVADAQKRRANRKARVRPPEPVSKPPAPKPKAPAPKPKAKPPAPKPPAPKPKGPAGGGGQPTDLFGGGGEVPVPSEPKKTGGDAKEMFAQAMGREGREEGMQFFRDNPAAMDSLNDTERRQMEVFLDIKQASDADYSLLPTGMRNALIKQNAPEQDDTNFSLLPRGWNEGGLQ